MEEEPTAQWYEIAFGDLYPVIYAHRSDEAASSEIMALIRFLGLEGSRIKTLDLCCGDGRHAAELRSTGLSVTGLDLSPQLITLAAERQEMAGRLVRGDMRHLPFADRFDLVVNLFSSFGYFPDDETNCLALGEMVRVLRPGGCLVIDHINRARVEQTLVPEDEIEGELFHIRQRRAIVGNRVRKEIHVTWADGRTTDLLEDVRLYYPEEMLSLIEDVSLTDGRLIGSYSGEPFTSFAQRMIVTASKPLAG